MAQKSLVDPGTLTEPRRVSESRRFFKIIFSRWLVVFGFVVIIALILTAIFAPWLAPYDPYEPDYNNTLLQPTREHLVGTDAIGRDTLSRIIYGTRTSLTIGLLAVGFASIIGITLGLVAGYSGGWLYVTIMRFVDALMSFPMLLLALVVAALLGGGMKNVVIALGISMMPAYARLMCGQVLSAKENDYVLAGRSLGASNQRLMFLHILPNCFSPLIVVMSMMMGTCILAEAGLSFLGIGLESPTASWGSMINDGREYLLSDPLLSFAPGFAIMLVVLSFNMVGDGLRDALDPRLRGTL
jgi:peptide/nickel transport system permease protein